MTESIVFMGTPEFSVPSLKALVGRFGRESIQVVTQPDRPAGRGRAMRSPAVKVAADELGLEVVQIPTLRDDAIRQHLTDVGPSIIVVAAFGLLLPRWVLQLPGHGCVNLHASLLPRFRGASPIPAAIATGDAKTGVSLMDMEVGLDTGAVYATQEASILPGDTTDSLTERLATLAADLLDRHIYELLHGRISPKPQRGEIIETRKIVKDHGRIDWHGDAASVDRQIRAMWPWPRAWTTASSGLRIQVHAAQTMDVTLDENPGTVIHARGDIVVQTGTGGVRLERVQLAGKAAQDARDLMQHPAFRAGSKLGANDGLSIPDPWIVPKGEA